MGVLDRFLTGRTNWQIAHRHARAMERLTELHRDGYYAAIQDDAIAKSGETPLRSFTYANYQDMIQAMLAKGPPIVAAPTLIDRYKVEWARKQSHSNNSQWLVSCQAGGIVEHVWWIAGEEISQLEGLKKYDMRGALGDYYRS